MGENTGQIVVGNECRPGKAGIFPTSNIVCNFYLAGVFYHHTAMKPFITLITLGVLLGSPVFLQAKITRTVEKTFTVQPGGDLKVQTSGGDIQVLTGTDNEVKVTARQRINADSEEKADELLKNLELTIEQQANNITAKAKYGKPAGWHWGSTPVTVSFTVVVPKHYNVDLNTSGGDIGLESISGQARLRTSIHVDRAGGEAELSTSGGDIVIDSVRGRLSASTSGGDIRASIEGSLKGSCALSTSGGNVTVSVEKSAAFDLKSRTSGGNVDADGLTIAIEKGGLRKSSLSGKVNGGGPELSLGTSGGDIRIRAK